MSFLNVPRVGRALVLVVAAILLADAAVQFAAPPIMRATFEETGLPESFQRVLPAITLLCAATLALRPTMLLGAVLTTGFLGGAIAIHMRLGEFGSPPHVICLLLGAILWTGILMAEPALRRAVGLRGPAPFLAEAPAAS